MSTAGKRPGCLAEAGYTVYLGDRPLPTPFLCYRHAPAEARACGVIVTASHNPKIYNGYKAYDDKGGQVVTPWDTEVEAAHVRSLPLVPTTPQSRAADARILPIPQGSRGGLHPA